MDEFTRRFGGPPEFVVRAPGRVNLIGDHTDYNDGFVLPMAIDRAVWIALRRRGDTRVVIHSLDFDARLEFALARAPAHGSGWQEYVLGVSSELRDAYGEPVVSRGWEGVMAGDVPVGAGLSSSAALELATARAFASACGIPWQPTRMASLAQRAENDWVGMKCGIMDQLISATGKAGHALLIDCRSLTTQAVAIPPSVAVVVLDTSTRRGLVDSAYNERRTQCETAAAFFGVDALRDVDVDMFAARASGLDPVTRKRARHVITENARTVAAGAALARGDVCASGALMNESHASLRDDFEVSHGELDTMVEAAMRQPGCHGARMTGAGFGGCAVALVDARRAPEFTHGVADAYRIAAGLEPAVYVCSASEGASVEQRPDAPATTSSIP